MNARHTVGVSGFLRNLIERCEHGDINDECDDPDWRHIYQEAKRLLSSQSTPSSAPQGSHTPGPWSWGEDFRGLFGSGQDGDVLTFIYYEGMHLSYGQKQEANARLIAAAPDLLDSLQELSEIVQGLLDDETAGRALGIDTFTLQPARAALAKAAGIAL